MFFIGQEVIQRAKSLQALKEHFYFEYVNENNETHPLPKEKCNTKLKKTTIRLNSFSET